MQLPLQDAIILAGIHFITLNGVAAPEDTAAVEANPGYKLDYYRSHLPEVMAAQSIGEHKATSGKGIDDLASSVRREHLRLSGALDTFAAQKVYIKRVRQLPEFGASFFNATLVRLPADSESASHGSRSAPVTPDWAERLTTDNPHGTGAPAPLPVLVAISAVGVMIRPLPPFHSPSMTYNYSAVTPARGAGTVVALGHDVSASEKLSVDGRPIDWMVHPVHYIEVWGVKSKRPCWCYRVRERELRNIELTTTSFKEVCDARMSLCVHVIVCHVLNASSCVARVAGWSVLGVWMVLASGLYHS